MINMTAEAFATCVACRQVMMADLVGCRGYTQTQGEAVTSGQHCCADLGLDLLAADAGPEPVPEELLGDALFCSLLSWTK